MRLVRAIGIWLGGAILGIAAAFVASVAIDVAIGTGRILDVTNVEVPASASGPAVRAYVARPTQAGPRPVVVMVHELFGVNESIMGKADLLAREGYLVVAPDTFRGSTTAWIPTAIFQALVARPEAVLADIDAASRWAKAQPGADPARVAILGFCYGGRTSLLYAMRDPTVAATVVFYGTPETDPVALRAIRGPVLGIFGGADRSIPLARVDGFRKGLEAAGVRHRVTVYEGQPHAFVVDAPGVRAGGTQAHAWNEMVGFLKESLESPPTATAAPSGAATAPTMPLADLSALVLEHVRGH